MQPANILRKRRSPKTHKSGFVLPDLLAGLALTALVVGLVLLSFSTGRQAVVRASQGAELQNSARFSIQYITREIQAAKQIMGIGSQNQTLTLVNQNNHKIVFRQSGGVLWRDFYETPSSAFRSTSHPLADQITELTFASQGNRGVKIYLTSGNGNQSYTLATIKFLRVQTD